MLDEETKARKERMKDYKRRYREKHGLKVHEHRWRNVLLTICAVAIVGTGSFFAAQSKAAQLVTLDGMSAVDLTDEDVNRYLDEREDGLSQKTIALKEDGMDEKISLKDVKAHFDREKIKENLFLVGRVGTPLQRISDVISTLRFGKDVPPSIAVDDDSLNTEVSRIHDTYDTDPENAYVTPNQDGTVRIHKERSKITIDTAGTMAVVAHDRVKSGNARYDGLPSSTISGHRMKRHGAGNDELVSLYGSGVDINGVSSARRSDVGKMGFIMTIVLDNRNAVYYIFTVNAPVFFIGLATVCARSDDDGNIRIGNTAGIELFYEDLEHDIAHAKARNITDDDGHSLPCLKNRFKGIAFYGVLYGLTDCIFRRCYRCDGFAFDIIKYMVFW